MNTSSFLDHAWQDMCALYADGTLSALCLELQDQFGVDVPLLLFLSLADAAQAGCSREAFATFLVGTDDWHETVVRPLRDVRRCMKGHFRGAEETALRAGVKRLELEAERLHVSRLIQAFPRETNSESALIEAYLREKGVPQPQMDRFCDSSRAAAAGVRTRRSDLVRA